MSGSISGPVVRLERLAVAAEGEQCVAAGPHARGPVKAGLPGTGRKTAVRLAATCAAGTQALRTLAGLR